MNAQQLANFLNWAVPISALAYSIILIYCHKHYGVWVKISLLAMPVGILIAYALTYIDISSLDVYKVLALRRASVTFLFVLHSVLALTLRKEHYN